MSKDLIIQLPKFNDQVSITGEWIEKRDEIISRVNLLVKIDSEVSFKEAGEILSEITKHSNTLEKMRQALTAPFLDAQKTIKKKSDDARYVLESEKPKLQLKISQYLEAERKRVEKEKRDAEEKQRQEILAQQAEQDALKEIGLVEKEAEFVPEVKAAPPIVQAPVSHSIRVQTVVAWEITDEALIPAAFKTFDERKLNAWIRDNKDMVIKQLKDNPDAGIGFLTGIKLKTETKPIGR